MVNQEWDNVEWIDDEIEVHQLHEKMHIKNLKIQEKSLPLLENGESKPFPMVYNIYRCLSIHRNFQHQYTFIWVNKVFNGKYVV
jgi:hypothetical protein